MNRPEAHHRFGFSEHHRQPEPEEKNWRPAGGNSMTSGGATSNRGLAALARPPTASLTPSQPAPRVDDVPGQAGQELQATGGSRRDPQVTADFLAQSPIED